jgi:hypothetical protein
VEEKRHLEFEPLRVVKEVRVSKPGGAILLEYEERVMLFAPRQLEEIFAEVGMRRIAAFGDYDGSPFHEGSSPRQLMKFSRVEEGR